MRLRTRPGRPNAPRQYQMELTASSSTRSVDLPIRVGIVGCGRMTRNKHLRVISKLPGIECVAVADLDEAARDTVADQYGIKGRYRDLQELLDHPDLDAVGLVLPTKVKADVTKAALRSGKALLLEKPVAGNLDQADAILDAAAHSSSPVLMGFHIAFHRLVQEALDRVSRGDLGHIDTIHTLWCSPWLNRQEHGAVPHAEMRRRHGEGALTDLGSQCFDLWRRFSGAEVDELWCQRSDGNREEEVATVNARMSNGVLATGVFSTRTTHEIQVEITGSGGRLRVSAERFDGLEWLPFGRTPGSLSQRLDNLRDRVAGE